MMMQDNGPLFPIYTVEEAKANVDFFTARLSELRVELEAERAALPDSLDEIQDSIVDAERHLDALQRKINQVKAQRKQRKQEIDAWKQWYGAIAPINKTQAWATLNMEISWRSQDIRECETIIRRLETEKLVTMSRVEKMHMQFAAFANGLYERPIEDDPRWLEAQQDLETAKLALKSTHPATQVAWLGR